jgi:hypothetical protein
MFEDMEAGHNIMACDSHLFCGAAKVEYLRLSVLPRHPHALGIHIETEGLHAVSTRVFEGFAAAAAVIEKGQPLQFRFVDGEELEGDPFPVIFEEVIAVGFLVNHIRDMNGSMFFICHGKNRGWIEEAGM